MKRRGLLLDRDGVINVDHGYVGAAKDFSFMPGLSPFLRRAQDLGYRLAIVTNQSGVARGYYTRADYDELTAYMLSSLAKEGLAFDLVLACFTHEEGADPALARASFWRKPNPGMILEAAMRLDLDLSASLMVGDKESDMKAGRAAGVGKCVLLGEEKTALPEIIKAKSLEEIAALL